MIRLPVGGLVLGLAVWLSSELPSRFSRLDGPLKNERRGRTPCARALEPNRAVSLSVRLRLTVPDHPPPLEAKDGIRTEH